MKYPFLFLDTEIGYIVCQQNIKEVQRLKGERNDRVKFLNRKIYDKWDLQGIFYVCYVATV